MLLQCWIYCPSLWSFVSNIHTFQVLFKPVVCWHFFKLIFGCRVCYSSWHALPLSVVALIETFSFSSILLVDTSIQFIQAVDAESMSCLERDESSLNTIPLTILGIKTCRIKWLWLWFRKIPSRLVKSPVELDCDSEKFCFFHHS